MIKYFTKLKNLVPEISKKIIIGAILFSSITLIGINNANASVKSSAVQNAAANKLYNLKINNMSGPIIKLSYNEAKNSTKVELQSKTGNNNWTKVNCTISFKNKIITYDKLSSNTSYKFRAALIDGKSSIYSNEISVTTPKTISYKTNKFNYTGEFKDGNFDGTGLLVVNKNVLFVNNKFYNSNEYINAEMPVDDSRAFVTEYSKGNNYKENIFDYFYPAKFQGTFKNGEITYGTLEIDNGLIYEGCFKNFRKNGEGVLYKTKNQPLLKGVWEDDGYVVSSKNDITNIINLFIEQKLDTTVDKDLFVTLKGDDKDIYDSKYYENLWPNLTKYTDDINLNDIYYYPRAVIYTREDNTKAAFIKINVVKMKPDIKNIKAREAAKNIIAKIITPSMSEIQKELAIHDYIVNNTKYDYDNFLKNTIPGEDYTAYGPLVNGTGVCSGYANAAKLLFDTAGIECIVVSGEANNGSGSGFQGHAWNIVKIDGKYYQLDTTWDDPISSHDILSYKYFNITDDKISEDHTWDKSKTPACTDDKFLVLRDIPGGLTGGARIGDSIYYKGKEYEFYRTNLCNPQKELVAQDVFQYKLYGDSIYIVTNNTSTEPRKLYRMKGDYADKVLIVEDIGFDFQISDDAIYYQVFKKGSYEIYKINIDGSGKTLVAANAFYFLASGEALYYCNLSDNHYLYKYDLKTDTSKLVYNKECVPRQIDGNLLKCTDTHGNWFDIDLPELER